MENVLITGANGFIGTHLIEYILEKTDWNIIAFVRGLNKHSNIMDIPNYDMERISVYEINLKNKINIKLDNDIDCVFHLAAKTSVDDSISNPLEFIKSNVLGTANLFEYIRKSLSPKCIINYSTDEVYGPATNYDFTEEDRWRPSSPYSASKCGQSALGMAYYVTYGLPIINTYTSNVFGERQSSDKLIPKAIHKFLNNEPMTIHAKLDDNNNPIEIGSRFWLYAKSAADSTLFLINKGKAGENYNIPGDIELNNLDLCNMIAKILNIKPKYEYIDFHKTRPGHDRRYALNGAKLLSLGWKSPFPFQLSLNTTVKWYLKSWKIKL